MTAGGGWGSRLVLTDEVIAGPKHDVLAEIQQRSFAAFVEREIAALAEVTSPEFARWAYQPTAFECYW